MSKGLNKVVLFGNLGADPELRRLPSGTAVLKVRLATTRQWVNRDGTRDEQTDWHSISVFGSFGEGLARVLKKGSYVCVEGRLHTYSYEKDGERRWATEVVAEDVVLGGRRLGRGDDRDEADDGAREGSGEPSASGAAAAEAEAEALLMRESEAPPKPETEGTVPLPPETEGPVPPPPPETEGPVPPTAPEAPAPGPMSPKPLPGGTGAPEPGAGRRKPRSPTGVPAMA